MKIALASDHAGYAEKERLKPLLRELGVEVDDLGTVSEASVDYPDYARKVAEQVARWTGRSGSACLRLRNRHGDNRKQGPWRARCSCVVRRDSPSRAST